MSEGDTNNKENTSIPSNAAPPPATLGQVSAPDKLASPMETDAGLLPGDVKPGDASSSTSCAASASPSQVASSGDTIDVKVVWNKTKYDVSVGADETVKDLKEKMLDLTGLPPSMQKIMYKGLCNDEKTMKDCKVTKGAKIMMVGSTLDDVLAVSTTPNAQELKELKESVVGGAKSSDEPLCKQKPHAKIIDKGPPEDATPGLLSVKEVLPSQPLSGMVNKSGGKVRLTFKLEADEVWIGTKERTEKVPMSSIKAVVSEPISGHEQYHMLALQLGPTEASRYWIYWVPIQYIDAIKRTILG